MDSLNEARKIIGDTDREIAKLFEKRMNAVKDVAAYKAERGIPVFDAGREAELVSRNSEYISDEDIKPYYITFLKNTMEVSKKYQHKLMEGMRIAYAGVEGAYAHTAARRIFPDGICVPYENFEKAFAAVENGECDCAVLPIENSYAGEVGKVTDLLFSGSLYISGVFDLKVRHCLLGVKGARLSDIDCVTSHYQALRQCENYIKSHNLKMLEATNTAAAAKAVADSGDINTAAIASGETAELYGLEILERNINESDVNATRFAVFSRVKPKGSEDGNFIITFTVPNTAGALSGAINIIGKHGYNLRVLRSRPLKEESWKYYFYVEAEGNADGEKTKLMLSELQTCCEKLKVAGSYGKEISI